MIDRTGVIGLDVGTTSVKAVGFDARGLELARASASITTWHDDSGAAEQDPHDVYTSVMDVLGRMAAALRALGHTPALVGFSAAMHSLMPVQADGTPLGRALLWMDTRAGADARALWRSPAGPALYARTGTPIHAMSPLSKLLWLRRERASIFAAAAKFVSLKEWIWHQWFGEWRVDASIASATGLYNLRDGSWDAEALRMAGITAAQLSNIARTNYSRPVHAGSSLTAAGIPVDTTVNIGASDGVLANLGVGAIGPDRLVITLGTSSAVRVGRATPYTEPVTRSFCYVLDDHHFIVGGPSNSGGIVLDWLARSILARHGDAHGDVPGEAPQSPTARDNAASATGDPNVAALLAAAASATPGELLCLPYVAGERAPLWRDDASGVVLGLRLRHTSADLMRAAVEGIIFNAWLIVSGVLAFDILPSEIVATGHVLDVPWIRQLTADVFDLPVRYHGSVDASATGAALLALLTSGTWSPTDYRAFQAALPAEVHRPSGHATYARPLARFQRLAAALTGDLAEVYLDS